MATSIEIKAAAYIEFSELYAFEKARGILDLLKRDWKKHFPHDNLHLALIHRVRFVNAMRSAVNDSRLLEYADIMAEFFDWFEPRCPVGCSISID